MKGNLLGDGFDQFVNNQIRDRQKLSGKGYNTLRNNSDLIQSSNKNAWIKLASSVSVLGDGAPGEKLLNKLGLKPVEEFLNSKLAQKSVLFNTFTDSTINTPRKGITQNKNIWNNASYGLGGSKYGLTPAPGIIDAKIICQNRGSIRKATVNIQVFNKPQFEIIELLYLKLGFTMILEWGWDKYITKNSTGELETKNVKDTIIDNTFFKTDGVSQLDMLEKIKSNRAKYKGNYDGFFGRVTNFNWVFNSDRTYNITLELITMGDVIESLKTNVPTLSPIDLEANERYDSNNLENGVVFSSEQRMNNKILDWLYNERIKIDKSQPNDLKTTTPISDYELDTVVKKNFFKSPTYTQGFDDNRANNNQGDPNINEIKNTANEEMRYYIRTQTLLKALEEVCIPIIQNQESKSPMLEIDTAEEINLMYVKPNQFPFDPRICTCSPINFDFSHNMLKLSNVGVEENNPGKGIFNPGTPLHTFLNPKKDKNLSTAKIMNLYINFNFIKTLFEDNTDEEGNVSLYKFLKGLCDGINSSFANYTKLEPIIKDDRIITLIDQNLHPDYTADNDYPLEVIGYNPGNETSNFIKNIEFNTEITPKLASSISISTTAENKTTQGLKGGIFNILKEGLQDRFSQQSTQFYTINNLSSKETEKIKKELGEFWENKGVNPLFFPTLPTSNITTKSVFYKGENFDDVTKEEFVERAFYLYLLQEEEKQKFNKNKLLLNYRKWLHYNLGGEDFSQGPNNVERVEYRDSKYWGLNHSWIEQGKNLYEGYLNYLETKGDNKLGFIPLNFTITAEGISGIKIYNKININNDFLPFQYPETFKFLIKQVNHSIKNNDWETELVTLSTSNLESETLKEITKEEEEITQQPEREELDKCSNLFQDPIFKNINQNVSLSTLGGLIRSDIVMLMYFISKRESRGMGDIKAENRFGYIGRYQFGIEALHELGYIKDSAINKFKNGTSQKSLLSDNNSWTGKRGLTSKQAFFNSSQAQNNIMFNYIKINYNYLVSKNTINSNSKGYQQSGLLAVSHLLGKGTAENFENSIRKVDGNGTSDKDYYNEGVKAYQQSRKCLN